MHPWNLLPPWGQKDGCQSLPCSGHSFSSSTTQADRLELHDTLVEGQESLATATCFIPLTVCHGSRVGQTTAAAHPPSSEHCIIPSLPLPPLLPSFIHLGQNSVTLHHSHLMHARQRQLQF